MKNPLTLFLPFPLPPFFPPLSLVYPLRAAEHRQRGDRKSAETAERKIKMERIEQANSFPSPFFTPLLPLLPFLCTISSWPRGSSALDINEICRIMQCRLKTFFLPPFPFSPFPLFAILPASSRSKSRRAWRRITIALQRSRVRNRSVFFSLSPFFY